MNLYEDNVPASAVKSVQEKIFKTGTGLAMLKNMFAID